MKTKVEVSAQVADFIRSLAPEPRRKLRSALHGLENEQGDFIPLKSDFEGYWRLAVGSYRIIFKFDRKGTRRVASCIFAEERSIVYQVFATLL